MKNEMRDRLLLLNAVAVGMFLIGLVVSKISEFLGALAYCFTAVIVMLDAICLVTIMAYLFLMSIRILTNFVVSVFRS